MKKLILTAIIFLIAAAAYSQNINGKLGTGGQFIIRDTNNTYLSLSQSNGRLSLNRSLALPYTNDVNVGVIYKGSNRFIHDFKAPSSDGANTFIGENSGNFTMNGSGINSGYNTGVGPNTLSSLTLGNSNSAFGVNALSSITSGTNNVGLGNSTLTSSNTGDNNTAIGSSSLFSSTGSNNTAVGFLSGSNLLSGSNNITIGNIAQVPNANGDNQVRIGNTNITYAGIQVAWTITSDRRWKNNIRSSELGLDFISKLNPVSYTRKNDESGKTEYGFIAQEVEEVLKQSGEQNTGMISVDDNGKYEMRYNDLIAPMVKAIKELKQENDDLKAQKENEITALKEKLSQFEEMQNQLMNQIMQLERKTETKEAKFTKK